MYRIKTIMFDDKMATIQNRSDLFAEIKKTLIEDIRTMANKQRELAETKDFWMEFWKWTGVAVAGVVAFLTGGLGGALMGALTAALVIADLATEGKATETMMKPLTDAIGPAFEKMITGLMDHLVEEEGYDEEEAIGITMAIFFGATILPTLLTGAGAAALSKFGETATGKAMAKSIEEVVTEVVESTVGKAIGAAFQAAKEGFDEILETVGVKAVERGFQSVLAKLGIETTEQYINFLMQSQTAASLIGTSLEGFFSIKGAIAQKEGQELSAEISLAKTDDEIISTEMKRLTDSFGHALPNKFMQILSELMASKENTMTFMHQSMRRA